MEHTLHGHELPCSYANVIISSNSSSTTTTSSQEWSRQDLQGLPHPDWHNRPDILLINYKQPTGLIIEIAVPRDENNQDKKELEKIDKYQSLKIELETRVTAESQNDGDPSSCRCSRCNSWQVTWLASPDTGNDQQGWTAKEEHFPRNGASPPAYAQILKALVKPRIWK